MTTAAKWIGLSAWLVLALGAGCRGSTEACSDELCGTAGAGGGTTSPEEEPEAEPPEDQAGRVPPPDLSGSCSADEQCDDGLACNGSESCNETCQAGEAAVCEGGTVCVDRGDQASCEFERASPWLFYIGDDREDELHGLFGIRLDALGRDEPLDLSGDATAEDYASVGYVRWSPDGRHVVAQLLTLDFTSRLYWLSVGHGLPRALEAIPGLPSIGEFGYAEWTRDSSAAVVENGGELYRIDFRGDEPVPALIANDPELFSASPCANRDYVLVSSGTGEYLVDAASDAPPELLGQGTTWTSPDQAWLVFASDESAAWYSECTPGAPRRSLGEAVEAVSWSSDSRYLSVVSNGVSAETIALIEVSVGPESPAWSGTLGPDGYARWSDVGSSLLVALGESSGGMGWHVLEMPSGRLIPLPAETAYPNWKGQVVEFPGVSEEESGLWILRPGDTETKLLAGCAAGYVEYDSRYEQALCVVADDATPSFRLVLHDLEVNAVSSSELLDMPLLGTAGSLAFSPDDGGVLFFHTFDAEQTSRDLLWLPLEPEAGPTVKINRGRFAPEMEWQPQPLPARSQLQLLERASGERQARTRALRREIQDR